MLKLSHRTIQGGDHTRPTSTCDQDGLYQTGLEKALS